MFEANFQIKMADFAVILKFQFFQQDFKLSNLPSASLNIQDVFGKFLKYISFSSIDFALSISRPNHGLGLLKPNCTLVDRPILRYYELLGLIIL